MSSLLINGSVPTALQLAAIRVDLGLGSGLPGTANGVALLDSNADLPSIQLPNNVGPFGPYTTLALLETAYPAAGNPGKTAYVGASAPYAEYVSNGSTGVTGWKAIVSANTDPITGGISVTGGSGPAVPFGTKIGIVVFGQSNELGSVELNNSGGTDQTLAYPNAYRSLIDQYVSSSFNGRKGWGFITGTNPLKWSYPGSPWNRFYDALRAAGYLPQISNMSVGGLSFINNVSTLYIARPVSSTAAFERRASFGDGVDMGDWGTQIVADDFIWYCSTGNARAAFIDTTGPSPKSSDGTGTFPTILDFVTYRGARTTSALVTLAKFKGIGSVSGNTLTIASVTSGALVVGQQVASVGNITQVAYISAFGTGTGGTGTYTLSASINTVTSQTIYATTPGDVSADGGVSWTAVSAANPAGVGVGSIISTGLSGGFDVLGVLRRVLREVQKLKASGCTRVIAIVCNGQSDTGASSYNYQKSLEGITAFLLGHGAEVGIGLSTFTRGGSTSDWDTLSAARTAALATYAADSRVFAGANLYSLMGATEGANGLVFNTNPNDGVHLGAPAAIAAGGHHAAAVLAYLATHP